jgi:hypothetical protein
MVTIQVSNTCRTTFVLGCELGMHVRRLYRAAVADADLPSMPKYFVWEASLGLLC